MFHHVPAFCYELGPPSGHILHQTCQRTNMSSCHSPRTICRKNGRPEYSPSEELFHNQHLIPRRHPFFQINVRGHHPIHQPQHFCLFSEPRLSRSHRLHFSPQHRPGLLHHIHKRFVTTIQHLLHRLRSLRRDLPREIQGRLEMPRRSKGEIPHPPLLQKLVHVEALGHGPDGPHRRHGRGKEPARRRPGGQHVPPRGRHGVHADGQRAPVAPFALPAQHPQPLRRQGEARRRPTGAGEAQAHVQGTPFCWWMAEGGRQTPRGVVQLRQGSFRVPRGVGVVHHHGPSGRAGRRTRKSAGDVLFPASPVGGIQRTLLVRFAEGRRVRRVTAVERFKKESLPGTGHVGVTVRLPRQRRRREAGRRSEGGQTQLAEAAEAGQDEHQGADQVLRRAQGPDQDAGAPEEQKETEETHSDEGFVVAEETKGVLPESGIVVGVVRIGVGVGVGVGVLARRFVVGVALQITGAVVVFVVVVIVGRQEVLRVGKHSAGRTCAESSRRRGSGTSRRRTKEKPEEEQERGSAGVPLPAYRHVTPGSNLSGRCRFGRGQEVDQVCYR
mmetsp:Transcript_6393/g.13829  ORF Transcript_6393/g.13829 Transcript_6393/m.13829 type:complete len:555 (+) Transcript_6393:101-1765(+)